MKLINTALLILGLSLAFLPTSYAQGVRSGNAVTDNAGKEDVLDFENDDEEGSLERLLASKIQQRCPFPGELKREYNVGDACKEGKPLFKKWKWCKKYCYVCPCWDEKSYYELYGDLIPDACTPSFCGNKNYRRPCKTFKGDKTCCDCRTCDRIEILPADHFLCVHQCKEATPRHDFNDFGAYVCDGECSCEEKECSPNRGGGSCSCETPCNMTRPSAGPNGEAICEAWCPGFGGTCVASGGEFCECLAIPPSCESTKPFPNPSGENICPDAAECPPGKGRCARVFGSKFERCSCQLCEDDFLSMSDEELFNYAVTPGNRVGAYCYIAASPVGSDNTCKYYAKEALNRTGIPLGSGCVAPPCFYNDPAMCTNSPVKNGAAQMRYAIRHKICGVPC
eukprot:CAMPEP_0202489972 /NCGR_PEP_ID=MMETSP1361-20130828/7516_1 /ASSEMBLY_ACC=CAM_ASM_000849 /TAXON_ID=210615 /ORGANISM="Staurosira complex sp., Strain CCMP2646" /LENGTH=394 /DNA_ID=CAMNT_0049119793 /DNA_START=558 /DNA_END=1742 /DNA_ORIENTATION=+